MENCANISSNSPLFFSASLSQAQISNNVSLQLFKILEKENAWVFWQDSLTTIKD